MKVYNFFSILFKKPAFYITPRNELFNAISLSLDQSEIIFKRIAEAKSERLFEKKLTDFFNLYPNTKRVAIVDNLSRHKKETIHILEKKINQLNNAPDIELIDYMKLSAMDHYYSIAHNSRYFKILKQNRENDLRKHLKKQEKAFESIHLNIIPVVSNDSSKELYEYLKKSHFQLVIMNEFTFEKMKTYLTLESSNKKLKINKGILVV